MIVIDWLIAAPLLLLASAALVFATEEGRKGDRRGVQVGLILAASWALPGAALVAHAMGAAG